MPIGDTVNVIKPDGKPLGTAVLIDPPHLRPGQYGLAFRILNGKMQRLTVKGLTREEAQALRTEGA